MWEHLFSRWPLVEADLHQVYGIDLDNAVQLRSRSWRWLKIRLVGLTGTECRLSNALNQLAKG